MSYYGEPYNMSVPVIDQHGRMIYDARVSGTHGRNNAHVMLTPARSSGGGLGLAGGFALLAVLGLLGGNHHEQPVAIAGTEHPRSAMVEIEPGHFAATRGPDCIPRAQLVRLPK